MNQTATLSSWNALLTAPADDAYDVLAGLLRLPRISEFPRPGDARTWGLNEWTEWGSERGFVLGAKTKHGQVVQHRQWPTVNLHIGVSQGDVRSAMNCAQDARHTLIDFLERARQACRILSQDGEQPDGSPADWLALKLSGAGGQTLMERARKVATVETGEQADEATSLLKRLRPFYASARAALIDIGCTEQTAERLILLNKGKVAWTFMGMAEQLIPVMRLLLADQSAVASTNGTAKPAPSQPEKEPEVLNPETVAQMLEVTSPAGQLVSEYVKDAFNQIERILNQQAAVVERAAHEIPDFVRTSRLRNNTMYRILNDFIEFQAKQHVFIGKHETSDLFDQLAKVQTQLTDFRKHAAYLRHVIDAQTAAIEKSHDLKAKQEELIALQKRAIAELEEKVTDPKGDHLEKKIKEVRGLFEGKLDVFELVKNVERSKQILDALIKDM